MRRRTEHVDIEFTNGFAKGWAFGVVDAFRLNLDIRLDQRIDSVASKAKENAVGRKLQPNEKVLRRVWTRGVPPAYSFSRGHLFHEPPEAHTSPWGEASKVLRRTVSIVDAQPDAGALIEVLPQEEDDTAGREVTESAESGRRGWVEMEILHYSFGNLQHKEKTLMYQSAFAEFLRTGQMPLQEEASSEVLTLTIEQALQRAIDDAKMVRLVYNGGSYLGKERPLIPIRLDSTQLTAREPGVDVLKPFLLRRIASVLLPDGTLAVNDSAEGVTERVTPYLASLDEYTKLLKPTLEAAGWNVFHQEPDKKLGVGRFSKSGKPLKHPAFFIEFMDRTQVEKLNIETGELFVEHRELTGRERPWYVKSELQTQAKAFRDLQRAVEFFAQEVAKSNAGSRKPTEEP